MHRGSQDPWVLPADCAGFVRSRNTGQTQRSNRNGVGRVGVQGRCLERGVLQPSRYGVRTFSRSTRRWSATASDRASGAKDHAGLANARKSHNVPFTDREEKPCAGVHGLVLWQDEVYAKHGFPKVHWLANRERHAGLGEA